MSIIRLTVGVPGCGKSTYAAELVKHGWVNVERDQVRWDLFGKWYGVNEAKVTFEHTRRIEAAVKSGKDVVVSDTNINPTTRQGLEELAQRLGAQIEYEFVGKELLHAELMERNNSEHRQSAGRVVPGHVMNQMYASYREQFPLKADTKVGLPAFVFDIDGTLAEMSGRSPYEWKRVGEDSVHWDVVLLARIFADQGFPVVIVSGRDGVCYNETMQWIKDNEIPCSELLMRDQGSMLKDSAVKHDIYHRHIDQKYNVMGVFDDRRQVVVAWRSMGLRCYEVNEANF